MAKAMKQQQDAAGKHDGPAGTDDGCDGHCGPERKTAVVDEGVKALSLKRLRRIEGQVRGIQKMVEADRYCADVLTQVAAVQEALRSVGKELLRHHLRHCAADAFRKGGPPADAAGDELIELFYKNAR